MDLFYHGVPGICRRPLPRLPMITARVHCTLLTLYCTRTPWCRRVREPGLAEILHGEQRGVPRPSPCLAAGISGQAAMAGKCKVF